MSTPARDLDGQVAVVTGSARALGQAIAIRLAEAGATIVGIDLAPQDETVALVEQAGGRAIAHRGDVTDSGAIEAIVADVVSREGRIDALVNNAGRWIDLERRPFWEIDVPEWDSMMTVNVRSAFVVSKAVSATMREARSGRIVNFASAVISFGMPDLLHYVASKSAIVGMTRSMARELSPYGVTVNAVAPGLVPTRAGREVMPDEFYETVRQTQLVQEPIEARDIADGVAYLVGGGARMVTGQVLNVSAGSTMGAM